MGKEVLKKFGRYFLLDQIAQGGMAEIYRARLAAADGAGRLIVIKRIQTNYGSNAEFLQMFKSEIKVTMGFNHPNIAQLYDFGEEQGVPYIAMEFVDGKNLRQLITRAHEVKQTFPVELAAFVIEQAACGLHYAHTFKDKISGQHLNIIHRDISPQNVLISFDGSVKVIDFGIAKTTINSEATRAGVIKGKPSYLSPEQISGDTLDARCDVFALGTVLWELLAGRKLFSGENDLAILKLIESCQTYVKPPSMVNPLVPKELDYIVLRTLAKQREKRYQSADELQRALHKFLYAFSPEFNPSDLSYYAKSLFENEIIDDRKTIQRLNDKVEQLLSIEIAESVIASSPAMKADSEPTVVARGALSTGSRDAFDAKEVKGSGVKVEAVESGADSVLSASAKAKAKFERSGHLVPPRQNLGLTRVSARSKTSWLTVAAALVGFVVFAPELGIPIPFVSDFVRQLSGPTTGTLVLEGDAKGITVQVNNETLATELPVSLKKLPAGRPLKVVIRGNGDAFEREVTLKNGESRVLNVKLATPAATVVGKGLLLRLNVSPGGGDATITVDGKNVDPGNPVIQIPVDSPLELVIQRSGFKPFKREFVVSSSQVAGLKEWLMDVQLDPLSFGFLSIHTTPSAEASIKATRAPAGDSKPWIKKTPFENEKMPVGTYNVRLYNEVLGMEKVVTVTIQENKVVTVDTPLELKD